MAVPLLPIAIAAATGLVLWAASSDEKKKPPAGPLPPGSQPVPPGMPKVPPLAPPGMPQPDESWFYVTPTGVLALRPERRGDMLAIAAQKFVGAPLYGPNYPPATNRVVGPGESVQPLTQWAQMEASGKGRNILLGLQEPIVASVAPGEEVVWAAASRKQFAVVFDAASAGQVPGVPGPTQPGSTTPAQPGQTIQIPGLPPITLPPGVSVPGVPGGPTVPASTTTPDPSQPQPQQPTPTPPGMPAPFPFPQTPAPTPAPPGTPGGGVMVPTSTGPWPASHVHKIRPGDLPSKIAQWYTGSFQRADELRALNNLKKVGVGSQTYYIPWSVGQLVKLPTDWDTSKGPPAPLKGGSGVPATPPEAAEARGNEAAVWAVNDAAARAQAEALKYDSNPNNPGWPGPVKGTPVSYGKVQPASYSPLGNVKSGADPEVQAGLSEIARAKWRQAAARQIARARQKRSGR